MKTNNYIFGLLLILVSFNPALALQGPDSYTLEASTFSAGGGEVSNSSHTLLGVIGQPGISGTSTGTTYSANHGFLSELGDGFKILYPVITATPGVLTFSLQAGSSNNLPLGISNSGGSTLNWNVTKGSDPQNIFSFTPAAGSNAGSITVTANAAALAAGTYHNTLTISGEGINQTALVQLDLTVTPLQYTLAVTLKQTVVGKGGGNVTSTVPDARLACNNSGSSTDVLCSADFLPGTTVTLAQYPDSNSTRGTWGAPGCGSNPSCQIVLNAPQGTTITFPYSSMAKVTSTGFGYEALALAYSNATASDTINVRAVVFPAGDLLLNSAKSIKLFGGLDAYFTAQNGQYSTLSGKLTIGKGSLVVNQLKIK